MALLLFDERGMFTEFKVFAHDFIEQSDEILSFTNRANCFILNLGSRQFNESDQLEMLFENWHQLQPVLINSAHILRQCGVCLSRLDKEL